MGKRKNKSNYKFTDSLEINDATYMDYLNRFRIQIASKLLLETGASISEIASLTGFQDQAYFCRVFRKVKGFPPGNIRSRSRS